MTGFAFLGTVTPEEWHEWEDSSVNVALADDGVRIATETTPTYVEPRLVVPEDAVAGGIVDVGQDDCGDLYLLGGTGDLFVLEPGSTGVRRLRCHGDRDWGEPRALCVTSDSIYAAYVDAGGRGLVRVVTKELRQTRRLIDAVPVAPETVSPIVDPVRLVGADERVLLVDRGDGGPGTPASDGDGRLVELHGDGTTRTVLEGLDGPTDLAVDDTGGLYVLLGRGPDAVLAVYESDGTARANDGAPDLAGEAFATASISVASRDELVGGIAAGAAGDRSLFQYRPEVEGDRFERIPAFGRACRRLLRGRDVGGDRAAGLYVLSSDTTGGAVAGITFLREAHRTRRNPLTGRYDAQLSARLDSGVPEVQWHRTRLWRTVEGRTTQVRVAYHATDDIDPDLDVRSNRWHEIEVPEAEDALLEDAVGRYLFVRLTLHGDEFVSPRVESFRAYFPRQSYLRYLPAIYGENETSRALLERYLSLFESAFVDIEEEIEHLTRYLDAEGVPTSHLSWLEGWLALETDETWPEPARRALVARAASLYRKRGTREGLLDLLELYLGHLAVRAAPVEADDQPTAEGARARLDDLLDDAGITGEEADEIRDQVDRGFRTVEEVRLDLLIDDTGLADAEADRVRDLVERGLLTVDEAEAIEARIAYEDVSAEAASALRSLLSSRAYVVEYGDLDCIDSEAVQETYDRLLDCPQCFLVLVRTALDAEERRAVTRLVEATRPAHAVGKVVPLQSGILLGGHAYLGINSVLPETDLVLSRSGLGRDSVLGDRVPHGQLEVRARLGDDTHLA